MNPLIGSEASEMFSEFHSVIAKESDRGAVLISAAILDEGLKNLIAAKLLESRSAKDPLFDGANAPIGTFSSRIEMVMRLGLITERTKAVLNIFRRLRNEFAHTHKSLTLEDSSAQNRLNEIFAKHKDIHDALVATARAAVASVLRERGNEDDADTIFDEHWPLRATFDFFFSMTAMAIHRVAVDVDRIASQVEGP